MPLCVSNGHQYLDLGLIVLAEICEAHCRSHFLFRRFFYNAKHLH